jgi:glycosyltransferase involved in cell wall biosynthesis
MKKIHSLSVILIAQNEADRIRPCLESVKGVADEIIVVDGGSTDGTVEICREYTDLVYETDWRGDGVQKQRALERASNEWVFRLDADERMSPELQAEVADILSQDTIEEKAFRVRWATYFFGRYLTHGEWGLSRHIKLFPRKGAHYDAAVVHAKLTRAPGPTRTLKGFLYHDANRDFHHLLRKLTDYACFAASDKASRGETSGLARAFGHGAWRFAQVLFLKRGFLDGRRGLLTAILAGQYDFNKYAALWALAHPSLPDQVDWQPPSRLSEHSLSDGPSDQRSDRTWRSNTSRSQSPT